MRLAQKKRFKGNFILTLAFLLAATLIFSGCQSVRFYRQAVAGQFQIFNHQRSVAKLLADPKTPESLKVKLARVLKMREFADKELKLPIKNQYLNYVDLHRPFAVWTVSAAPALSLQPKTWWFPIVGRASYRGYFSREGAKQYGDLLEKKGWDVSIGGVETYSTLGWFRDPLLSTFMDEPEEEIADTLFHELAHQKLFIAGDTDFNETFATAVAEEGVRRWFLAQGKPEVFARFQTKHQHEVRFVKMVLAAQKELGTVYEDPTLSTEEKLARKKEIIARLQKNIAGLKTEWGGDTSFDGWLNHPINNARLASVATYYELVPAFHELLRTSGGDMVKFYAAVKTLGNMTKEKRHLELQKLSN